MQVPTHTFVCFVVGEGEVAAKALLSKALLSKNLMHAREATAVHSIPPQRERVDLVTALRSHFASEERSFSMVHKSSNGRGAKFHCDGCSFEFRITKCTNSNSDLCGTWDVAKKSKESWKVCLPHALKGIDIFAQRVPTLVCLLA